MTPAQRIAWLRENLEEIAKDLETAQRDGEARAKPYASDDMRRAAILGTVAFRAENAAFRLRLLVQNHLGEVAREEVA